MITILDRSQEETVAGLLLELMDDAGYAPEEFIPGLILATKVLASRADKEDQVLDEAFTLLETEDDDS